MDKNLERSRERQEEFREKQKDFREKQEEFREKQEEFRERKEKRDSGRTTPRSIRVGSRDSRLAVCQAQIAMEKLQDRMPDADIRLLTMKTSGDRILDRSLELVGGKGLFVKELDCALLEGRCDLTVHSLKDMPMETREELPVLAVMAREDCRDALVLRKGLSQLPPDPVIGTSSRRRKLQGEILFPTAQFKNVRGNLQTRLKKLDSGEYDALILAAAGLIRLGLSDRISRFFSVEEMVPAAGQGILAVQGRREPGWEFVREISEPGAAVQALAERSFVSALNGGCTSPSAAVSWTEGETLHIRGFYWDEKTGECRVGTAQGKSDQAGQLGSELADALRSGGGKTVRRPGKVYLVGAGPGDAGLMTLRARELLAQADTVVYDALLGNAVLGWIPEGARTIFVGKRSGSHYKSQEDINRILVEEGRRGGTVVRLKGGDPLVFGRGGEEAEALHAHEIPFEIVPGVSSSVAVPAYCGIPITQRGLASSFHIITGHRQDGTPEGFDYEAMVRMGGTLCFLMGVAEAGTICSGLLRAGMNPKTSAAFLESGTLANQRKLISTLEHLEADGRAAGVKAPAILLVGDVCRLEPVCAWAEKRPLAGMRILITRPRERSERLAARLRAEGAEVLELPAIRTVPVSSESEDGKKLETELEALSSYGWLVFTSPAGVRIFLDKMAAGHRDIRGLAGLRIGVIGSGTAEELKKAGLYPDYMPEQFYSRELGEGLGKAVKPGEKVLILRARRGSKELTEALTRHGVCWKEAVLYDTEYSPSSVLSERVCRLAEEGGLSAVTFTSASTVEGFVRWFGEKSRERCSGREGGAEDLRPEFRKFTAVCIGIRTEERARKAGMRTVLANEVSEDALYQSILALAPQPGADILQ